MDSYKYENQPFDHIKCELYVYACFLLDFEKMTKETSKYNNVFFEERKSATEAGPGTSWTWLRTRNFQLQKTSLLPCVAYLTATLREPITISLRGGER